MKGVIVKLLKKVLAEKGISLNSEDIEKTIEIPPSSEFGDYSFPCFFLSKMRSDRLRILYLMTG